MFKVVWKTCDNTTCEHHDPSCDYNCKEGSACIDRANETMRAAKARRKKKQENKK